MEIDSGSTHFTDFRSPDTNLNGGECMNPMVVNAFPVGIVHVINSGNVESEGDLRMEPSVGLEFDSSDEARDFYGLYAMRVGFKIRTGQLYRSRRDGSVSSRRFVCSKEGFQLNSRTGCPAFIRVQRRDSGKWVIDQIQKDHNHELGLEGENNSPVLQQKPPVVPKSLVEVLRRPKVKLLGQIENGGSSPSGIINFKRQKRGGDGRQPLPEPYTGLEFNTANEAYEYYQSYAESVGFRVRIGQLFRSKNDGSITSRRFVCSKEGFQHPSRVGCGAFMRIKKKDSGSWMVDRLNKDHNHDLGEQMVYENKFSTASKKFIEEETNGETVESFFGTQVNGQTPLREFIPRYEQGLEQRREDERKEDFNSFNLQSFSQTKEAIEEQCRRLYTFTIFKIFQDELLQSYSYIGIKTYEEGTICRYLVRRSGNENDKHAVTFSAVNLSVNCSCQMFEFEGVLCRHVLKVFKLLNIRELPSQYILPRWLRNAEYRILCGAESGVSSQELKAFMIWSLRETACKYVECGTTSVEKYKLAYEIMREGGKKLY
ncbi:far1-related sequence 7 -like protein [Gossypium arboreum]|uniref:Protein FAR1-RELATED SEQUENCE n=1 Tax=Gossypium arboreum TaxID=29729 RepID=A0A0B0NQK9_GOSAR|nr:far1-related sequence 7 -like protein [Gossypium arboreum]